MSTFENSKYRWRETYFVLFRSEDRPKLKALQQLLKKIHEQLVLSNPQEEDGFFESLTIEAPLDHAALDICYIEGEEVKEQLPDLIEDLKRTAGDEASTLPLQELAQMDARLDVLHFEEIAPEGDDESEEDSEEGEMVDPSALLLVLGALEKLTGGWAIDPQTGTILNDI